MKKDKALAGIDMIIAVIVVIIFSTLILSLITNNALENVKTAKESMAMIYITEIFENIAIEKYENVTEDNINKFIPEQALLDNYRVEMKIEENINEISEDIIKKVTITLFYEINEKEYQYSMERLKIRE